VACMQGERLEPSLIELDRGGAFLTIHERNDSPRPPGPLDPSAHTNDHVSPGRSFRNDRETTTRVIGGSRNIRAALVSRASGDPSRGHGLRGHGLSPIITEDDHSPSVRKGRAIQGRDLA